MPQTFSLGPDGFYRSGNQPFLPVGVNYWPGSCADDQEMWARWPGKEIRADLAKIAAAGINAVRVNPPQVEAYRVYAAEFVRLAVEAGLAVVVSGSDTYAREGALNSRLPENVFFSARPGTHLLRHDGLLDPFFQTFLPFAVGWARLKRPALVANLGFGEPAGVRQRDAFLRAILPAAHAAGAAGFFWRGWRDTPQFSDGLFDAAGTLKPGLEYFHEFGRSPHPASGLTTGSSVVGLLVQHDEISDEETARRVLLAHYLLRRLGYGTKLLRELPVPESQRQVLIAGTVVRAAEAEALLDWVHKGGELFWHGPDLLTWNVALEKLLGSRPVDWRSGRGVSVEAFGERFTLAHFPNDVRAELEPCGARVLAQDHQGFPVLLEHQVGRGRVRYALPMVEEAIVPVSAHPTPRDRWAAWYRGLLTT